MSYPPGTPPGAPPPAASTEDPVPCSLADVLHRTNRQCRLLSYLAGSREGLPPQEVWEALDETFADFARLFRALTETLPAEVLDAPFEG